MSIRSGGGGMWEGLIDEAGMLIDLVTGTGMLVGLVEESLISAGLGGDAGMLLGRDGDAGEMTGFAGGALKVVSSGGEERIPSCAREARVVGNSRGGGGAFRRGNSGFTAFPSESVGRRLGGGGPW